MNLKANVYSVTAVDGHGCKDSSSVQITQPFPLQYEININAILCFGGSGDVELSGIAGGVSPVMTSIDGNSFLADLIYTDLIPGMHTIEIKDLNGCKTDTTFLLTEPENWTINLGPDTTLAAGTSFDLATVVNGQPNGLLKIKWSDAQCNDCLLRTIQAFSTKTYSVVATDENGCTSEDTITINVVTNRDVYIPTIFSPNGDGLNELFLITTGTDITEIQEMSIFDRWGNLVFSETHFSPNDPVHAWDGRSHGKLLNTGVYVYKVNILFNDSTQETRSGDVTLVR